MPKKIIITDDRHSASVPIAHNGAVIVVPVGIVTEISDDQLTALANSSIAFELVEDGDGAARGLAEPSPTPQPEPDQPVRPKKAPTSARAKKK